MSRDIQCTITDRERARLFVQVFGTPTVYLKDAVGEIANLPGLGERHVYKLDMDEVTPDEKMRLAEAIAARFNLLLEEVLYMLDTDGVPILAEHCVLTLTGAAARSLMPDDMDWSES